MSLYIDPDSGLRVFYICLAFGVLWLALLGLAKLMTRGHPPTDWQGEKDDFTVLQEWMNEYQAKEDKRDE